MYQIGKPFIHCYFLFLDMFFSLTAFTGEFHPGKGEWCRKVACTEGCAECGRHDGARGVFLLEGTLRRNIVTGEY